MSFDDGTVPRNELLYWLPHVSAVVEVDRAFGELRILPRCVRFDAKGAGGRFPWNPDLPTSAAHTKDPLVVIYGRLLPPWFNTGIVLCNEARLGWRTAVVHVPTWQRRHIVARHGVRAFRSRPIARARIWVASSVPSPS